MYRFKLPGLEGTTNAIIFCSHAATICTIFLQFSTLIYHFLATYSYTFAKIVVKSRKGFAESFSLQVVLKLGVAQLPNFYPNLDKTESSFIQSFKFREKVCIAKNLFTIVVFCKAMKYSRGRKLVSPYYITIIEILHTPPKQI